MCATTLKFMCCVCETAAFTFADVSTFFPCHSFSVDHICGLPSHILLDHAVGLLSLDIQDPLLLSEHFWQLTRTFCSLC